MPLKATQKKIALQKRIGALKKELALQKRIEDLEIKNQKLEQKLKLKKSERVMPKQEKNVEQEKNNYRKVAGSDKWMNPVLTALKELGGSGTPKEVIEKIVKNEKVPDEVREIKEKNGSSKFDKHVHWARKYLVWEGLVDGSKRGIWTLTPLGKKATLTEEDARKIRSENDTILKNLNQQSKQRS
ncbi:MAG: winged helix-turn-helix domain-containing protein [Fibromonadaceae bacterium]|jgi:hypothetical protein|nr:winged helix-turn-helix domain-containing protein [Fibromonadaceae bacterium]